MNKQYSKLLKNLPLKTTPKYLEDLQYNLSTFMNEDVYITDFNFNDVDSMNLLRAFIRVKLIYITKKDNRILLLPAGETLLTELNYMLLYID